LSTPQREIFESVSGTRWTPYEARFARASKSVMADIEIGHRGCLASLWVSDVALVPSMERAGYTVSDQTGERSLRGLDEVAAEREMLERAVARPATILAWSPRRARKMPAVQNRKLDATIVRSMRDSKWHWAVTGVGRRGSPRIGARSWTAYASCLVIDDDGPCIEVGMRIHSRKKAPGPDMREARKKLAAALGPFGYVSANVRAMIILEKSVRDAGEARVERDRLDRFLG